MSNFKETDIVTFELYDQGGTGWYVTATDALPTDEPERATPFQCTGKYAMMAESGHYIVRKVGEVQQ